jgi:hypothetical protein
MVPESPAFSSWNISVQSTKTARRPRTMPEELEALRREREHTRRLEAVLWDFLTVEGLEGQWPIFLHARMGGRPYTPVRGRARR